MADESLTSQQIVPEQPLDAELVAEEPARGGRVTVFRMAPLPDPDELAQYDKISKGFGASLLQQHLENNAVAVRNNERALTNDIDISQRAIALEEENSKRDFSLRRFGMFFGFIVVLACIAFMGWCVSVKANVAAFAAFVPIATLAGVFVYIEKSKGDSGQQSPETPKPAITPPTSPNPPT